LPKKFKLFLIVLGTAAISASLSSFAVWRYLSQHNASLASASDPLVADFSLLDSSGRHHQLYDYKNAKAVVLFSYDINCPSTQNSLTQLNKLQQKYASQDIEFLLLNSGFRTTRVELQAQSAESGNAIPILEDPTQLVLEDLAVARSGEAIVVDTSSWQIRYRGPVIGSQNEPGSEQYLQSVLDAVLSKQRPQFPVGEGDGCFIEFEDKQGLRNVSYTNEIVPLLREKCMSCHRVGGIAPWSMDDHSTVKAWSTQMHKAVMNNRMPPWGADSSIGIFEDDRSLSVAQKRTLVHWIKAGAPKIEKADPLGETLDLQTEEWLWGEPDLVIDIPQQKIPESGVVPYRWVRIPTPMESDTWISAVHLKPSNPSAMHHGFVFIDYPKARKKDQPSWLEGLNGFFTAYVPGVNPLQFPKNSGQLIPKGATLVFQLHYVTSGTPQSDSSKLALYFHKTPPPREYVMASASNMNIRIPAHAPEHEEIAEATFSEPVELHVLYPHMHYRGKRFEYQAVFPDGHSEKLLSVPKYNIHWQSFYSFEKPMLLPAGTKIHVDAAFDNSSENPVNPDPTQEVVWGLKSRDEMLVGYLMYTRERIEAAKE